jgi:hypothetical protein
MSQNQRDKEIAAFERTLSDPAACAALFPGVESHLQELDAGRMVEVFAHLVEMRYQVEEGEAAKNVQEGMEDENETKEWHALVHVHAASQRRLFRDISVKLSSQDKLRVLLSDANRALQQVLDELELRRDLHSFSNDTLKEVYQLYAQKKYGSPRGRRLWYEDWAANELTELFRSATGRPQYNWITSVFQRAFPSRPNDFSPEMLSQKVRRYRAAMKEKPTT